MATPAEPGARGALRRTESRAARVGGLQLEIVSSLFVVMLAGLAIVAVVMAAVSVRAVRESAVEQLELTAAHLERAQRLQNLGLEDLAAYVHAQESRLLGGEWWVLDAAGADVQPALSPLPAELADLAVRAAREGGAVSAADALRHGVALARALRAREQEGVLLGRIDAQAFQQRFAPLLGSLGWVLALAAAVFVGFGSYLLRRRIVQPLRSLAAAMREMGGGDLEVRTPVAGAAEIAELAQGFNEMAASLARERQALVRVRDSLLRSQRLAAVGQLAAGVAHEVGNPVAAVLGYAEVLLRDAALGERSRDAAERVRREALRVRTLVRELLDLARPQQLSSARWAPAELLRRTAELLRAQPLLAGVELTLECAPELPSVDTDAARVEQILVNLVENAAHALRGRAAARIALEARSGELRPLIGRRRQDAERGGAESEATLAAVLSVLDNGPGIDPELLPRIFDPFFTTKEPGEGTGLGLWNAHRLAELLGGRLEVESAPGRTRFSLMLPAADTQAADV